jgi:hypothetical protein
MDLSEFGNWKNIEGYANYMVSDLGFVMNNKTLRILRGLSSGAGYEAVSLFADGVRKREYIHRLVACEFLDNPNNLTEVDHVDRNKCNNSVDNLRWCSRSENCSNRGKKENASSSFKGVTWHKQRQKWQAAISVEGKSKHLGLFESEVQAAVAYNNAAIQYYAEFACLNVIPIDSIADDA